MKKLALPILFLLPMLALSLVIQAQNLGCDGARYLDDQFATVKKTTVQYATATNQVGAQVNLSMDVYEPEGDNLGARPVVVLAHGGSFIFGDKNDMRDYCTLLAKKGYVAATIQYRLYPFFILGLPDSVKIFDQAVRAVGDMKAAVRYFREDAATANLYRADAENIFIGGYSAGAVAALHAGFLDSADVLPTFIQTAINANGGLEGNSGSASNQTFSSTIKAVVNMSGGIYRSEWVDNTDIALASVHGTADATVPYLYGLAAGIAYLEGSGLIHPTAQSNQLLNSLQTVPNGGHVDIYSAQQAAFVPHIDSFWISATTILEYLTCLEGSSSVDIYTSVENWSLFPNPSTDGTFRIQLPTDVQQIAVTITDLSGKVVFQSDNVQNQHTVRLNGVPAGIYAVQVQDVKNSTRRFATQQLVLTQ
jgi:para-nitrobenzyl esterase